MSKLRITKTVTLVQTVEFNEENYPGLDLEGAIAYEQDQELGDKLEAFADVLGEAEYDAEVGEAYDDGTPVGTRGKYEQVIEVIE